MSNLLERLADALADRYAVDREIGRGGMATVFLARDLKHGRQVAVKVLRPDLTESLGSERFLREIAVTAKLNHPHILPLLDSGESSGFLYYVMPYVKGETLRDRMNREGQLPVNDALEITREVAAALAYSHEQDVIHRDIKPENVLLSAGEAVVADFGIAGAVSEAGGDHLTATGISVGTPSYMSPEQASGGGRIDGRSDLYSLGSVLYEMLVGEPPYTGPTVQVILARKAMEPVPSLRVARDTVPAGVEDAVVKALARTPADRHQTVRQFAEALRETPTTVDVSPDGRPQRPRPRAVAIDDTVPLPFETEQSGIAAPTGLAFVGRGAELDALDGFLDRALANEGRAVFVAGEAGSGKTALASEFCRQAARTHGDLIVAIGSCNAYTGVGDPYLPFREILSLLTGDVEARYAAGSLSGEHSTRLWNLIPTTVAALIELGPDLIDTLLGAGALSSRASRYASNRPEWREWAEYLQERPDQTPAVPTPKALFDQYARVLKAVARDSPLLLALDDLQWADDGSVNLLFHLARELAGSRILIVGLYRPSDIALGRDGDRHPMEAVLNELQRVSGDSHVTLGETEDRAFVDALVDSEPNALGPDFREALFERTRGDALFTVELLRGMRDDGVLTSDDCGRWTVDPTLDWGSLPARVEAVIAERVARVPEPMQRLLSVASVEGEWFTLEAVAEVLDQPVHELASGVGCELERRHKLVRADGIRRVNGRRVSVYRFRHILFQRFLHDRLDDIERSLLHERLGIALEALYGEHAAQIAPALARHFAEGGASDKAVAYLYQAGERAVGTGANRDAQVHFDLALELLLSLPPSEERDRRELAVTLALGNTRHYTGSPGIVEAFERALELAQQLDAGREAFWALTGLYFMQGHFAGDNRRGRELAKQSLAIARSEGDKALISAALENVGRNAYMRGDFRGALACYEEQSTLYRPGEYSIPAVFGGLDQGAVALGMIALAYWELGYGDHARDSMADAISSAREADVPFVLPFLLYWDTLMHMSPGDAQYARERCEEFRRISSELDRFWEAVAQVHIGWCQAHQGDAEAGVELLQQGCDGCMALGWHVVAPYFSALLAEALGIADRADEGLRVLERARSADVTVDSFWRDSEIKRIHGDLLMALDEPDPVEAEAAFRQAIEIAREQEGKFHELRATVSLARLLHSQERTDEGRAMLGDIYGWFTEGFDTADLTEARDLLAELAATG